MTRPIWSEVFARELYNHTGDDGHAFATDRFENENIAEAVDASLLALLGKKLRAKFNMYMLDAVVAATNGGGGAEG